MKKLKLCIINSFLYDERREIRHANLLSEFRKFVGLETEQVANANFCFESYYQHSLKLNYKCVKGEQED